MAKAVARTPPDMQKWPHNPESNFVDAWPRWRDVYDWDLPVSKLRQVDSKACAELCELNLFDKLTPQLQQAVRAFAEGRSYDNGETQDLILTPEKIGSLAERSNNVEIARSSIDARALFQLAASAIATGDLTGTPLDARGKADLLKFLINKVVPDMKSSDSQETVQRIDRGRRAAKDLTTDEIKAMTRQELLDLLDT
jgi:hypothetical protein